jgi:DNA-directed RNA polymerase III subunit RPC5
MTIKTAADGETVTTETMADRLRSVQSEPWRRMQFTDEDAASAWDVYNESLFLKNTEAVEKGDDKEGEAKGEEQDLEETVPRLQTQWGDKELLEAVSDIKKPEPKAEDKPVPVSDNNNKAKGKGKHPEPQGQEPSKPRAPGRTRGGAAAGAKRGGRPKAAASKAGSSTVNVD